MKFTHVDIANGKGKVRENEFLGNGMKDNFRKAFASSTCSEMKVGAIVWVISAESSSLIISIGDRREALRRIQLEKA